MLSLKVLYSKVLKSTFVGGLKKLHLLNRLKDDDNTVIPLKCKQVNCPFRHRKWRQTNTLWRNTRLSSFAVTHHNNKSQILTCPLGTKRGRSGSYPEPVTFTAPPATPTTTYPLPPMKHLCSKVSVPHKTESIKLKDMIFLNRRWDRNICLSCPPFNQQEERKSKVRQGGRMRRCHNSAF